VTRLRSVTLSALHGELADATLAWEPVVQPSSLDRYLVAHGVPHLVELGQLDGAEERMLDLSFQAGLLRSFDTPEKPLAYWRAIGLDRAQAGFARLADGFGERRGVRVEELSAAGEIGLFLVQAGLIDCGAALLEALRGAVEEHLDEEDPDLLEVHALLAFALEARGDLLGALGRSDRAVRGSARLLGPTHALTLNRRNHQGRLLQQLGRLEEAVELFRENHLATAALEGSTHPNTLVSRGNLGTALSELGQGQEALAHLEEAHAGLVQGLGARHPLTLGMVRSLALAQLDDGDPARALQLLEECADQQEKSLGPGHPDLASTLHLMASLFFDAWEFEAARLLLERVLEVDEASLGAGHPETERARYDLGRVLGALGRMGEARALLEQRVRAPRNDAPDDQEQVASAHFLLAQILEAEGDEAGAAEHLRLGTALEEQRGAE
jgi:tetratricopeptide (TPR) repeat protein